MREDFAPRRPDQSDHHPHERALAAAAGAENGQDLVGRDVERDVLQNDAVAPIERDPDVPDGGDRIVIRGGHGSYRRNSKSESAEPETIARVPISSSDAAGGEQCNSTLREFGPWRNDFIGSSD